MVVGGSGSVGGGVVMVLTIPIHGTVSIGLCAVIGPCGNCGANLANRAHVVEETAELVVAGFGGHEVVEPSQLVERWYRTTIV